MSDDLKEAWADVVPEGVPVRPATSVTSVDRLEAAAACWRRRKARQEHPDGIFDKHNRWYPSSKEKCECCRGIRSPSVSWPYSLMLHCRSIEHVANLFGVDVHELRRLIRPRKAPDGPATCWERLRKAV